MVTTVAGGAIEHLSADAMQGMQIRLFRPLAPLQLDLDQPAQS